MSMSIRMRATINALTVVADNLRILHDASEIMKGTSDAVKSAKAISTAAKKVENFAKKYGLDIDRMKEVYNDNPAEVAKQFEQLGFKRLHVVDLDGAKSKHIVNDAVLKAITTETSLVVDFGGGIKTEEDIEKAFAAGASMVTVGSIAVTHPELFMQWMDKYGADKLILGADVRNGKISINGWKEDSSEDLLPFLKQYIDKGVKNVLCTEISKDGTLQGPAIELYKEIMAAYPHLHLIASGGVSCNQDIKALDAAGIPAVVFGKAFYEGKIQVEELF